MFVTSDGRNVFLTFCLVSSLFLLWGFCNGMIDVMDKHFQEALHLNLAQSAWVQFAHYLGYFLMSLPAGWLATRLGYRGGIVAGLLLVAVGGFWFVAATKIAAFWAFLLGVCVIASGLTFLETVANPYTTVLGAPRYKATRINLAQSCNGVGWILGPIAGSLFFYGKDASGRSTGSETLWIPYAGVAVLVIILAVVFFFAPVPDIKAEDDFHLDDQNGNGNLVTSCERQINRRMVYLLLWLNVTALIGILGMILWLILLGTGISESLTLVGWVALLASLLAAILLFPVAKRISHHNVWAHEHFSGATLAQFFYVAAQAGIFSFLMNYMTSEPPPIPGSWNTTWTQKWLEVGEDGLLHISNQGASGLASVGFVCFLIGRISGAALLKKSSPHKVLGLYGLLSVVATFLVFCKLGWLSVACVLLSYFFMSIMFPTIFALGIFGLGARAKRASAYIVMGIMGGAMLPKVMGAVADEYGMSRGFIVPMFCFVLVALYGYLWPNLSKADSLYAVGAPGGAPSTSTIGA
jgi:FHS family L-fucose permease-like MFS transporter